MLTFLNNKKTNIFVSNFIIIELLKVLIFYQIWCWKQELNPRPMRYEGIALPAELFQHKIILTNIFK